MSEVKTVSSIYEKIEKKGKIDADDIFRVGQEKASVQKENILAEARKESELILNKSAKRNENKLKTKITQLEQKAKQISLLKKKELINKTYELAHQRLKEINDNKFFDLIVKMIKTEKIIGDEVLKVSSDDYQKYLTVFSSNLKSGDYIILDKLNSALGKTYQLKLSQDFVDIKGGFIIEGSYFDIDRSFKTTLDNLKEQYESKIASMLFDNGD